MDNDEARRGVELCYRTRKTLVNPIIDWTEDEVWEFLNDVVKVPHCSLYDDGFKRLGCIACPMASVEQRKKDLERWPTYKKAYMRAFEKMVENHPNLKMRAGQGTAADWFYWWLEGFEIRQKEKRNKLKEINDDNYR